MIDEFNALMNPHQRQRLANALMANQYDRPDPPPTPMRGNVVDRAGLLPLGTYEDGSTTLAWPGFLASPAHGFNKLMQDFSKPGYETGNQQTAEHAFDAAGGAMTGGLLAPRPQNAAGSNMLSYLRSRGGGAATEKPKTIIDGYHGNTGLMDLDKVHDFWGTTSKQLAEDYDSGGGRWGREQAPAPTVLDVQARFRNPYVVDAGGQRYDKLPAILKSGERIVETDDYARLARNSGHDGIVFKNIVDPPMYGPAPLADTFAGLERGTIYDRKTGKLIYSNGIPASAVGLLNEYFGENK